jgi:ABC-type Fe3+-hydroxamate transport system substrate-binding protein
VVHHVRLAVAVSIVLFSLTLASCGDSGNSSSAEPSSPSDTTAEATTTEETTTVADRTVRDVKLGMTKARVTSLLGSPDETNELYGLADLWVDWLWRQENGTWAVTFSKGGMVTRIMDCPNAICTVIADST